MAGKVIPLGQMPEEYKRPHDGARFSPTATCVTCHHQYGAGRPQCPACGTVQPKKWKKEPRVAREKKAKRVRPDACALCLRGHPEERCNRCNKPCHKHCLRIHTVLVHA
jgi:hypothetical protein